ncbi:hypothetical protein [Chryseobacterium sp.]|uniref:hypothetical protein n=1 Tax=Chryseobacterium sp. TaxID=1871047 RepID=UPI00289B3983|nr:hypothetical protein [Chryseobacterium sp.]
MGIVLRQLDNKIGAISVNMISKLFSDNGIKVFEEEFINEIPTQLEADIADIISNYEVQNRLDEAIADHANWILLEGNPGTGKTVNVAAYRPDENSIVLGKYFTKVPDDEKPKSLRISRENFFNWIEESIVLSLSGELPPRSNDTFEKRLELSSGYFEALGTHLDRIEKVGVFFIDGLDEIADIRAFLDIIPQSLHQRIRIVLSCTSRELLPRQIANQINPDEIIKVSPLDIGQCEYFIQQRTVSKDLDYESIQKISIKSEGHPLYLHYLIDFIVNSAITADEDDLEEWIDSIPVIGGNIENYYEIIWGDIYADSSKLWILLILSQLRQSISPEVLVKILPESIRLNYYSVLPGISHLIKGRDKYEIYHNSFKDYIQKKAPLHQRDCNDLIVKYCMENLEDIYSISNIIYHQSLSSNPGNALIGCNQQWADKLAVHHVEPDLVISDIKSVIELSIDLKKTTELLRLLLLLQRIDFRYNSVLVEYVYEMALGLIANGKYEQALKYLVRRNVLLVGVSDAIHFLQHFFENAADAEADVLIRAIDADYRKTVQQGALEGGVNPLTFLVKARTELFRGDSLRESHFRLYNFLSELTRTVRSDGGGSVQDQDNAAVVQYIRDQGNLWMNAFALRFYGNYFDIAEMTNVPNIRFDRTWTGHYVSSLLIYKKELDSYNLGELNTIENEKRLVNDVEFLIENYGYKEEPLTRRMIILALLDNTSKPQLLRQVMQDYLADFREGAIKNPNGVDFDRSGYEKLCTKNNCLGFLDAGDDFDIASKQWFGSSWEGDLYKLIGEIHFFEGKLFYYKATRQLQEKRDFIRSKFSEIVETIHFNFDLRSYWKNGYLFPEQVFPLLYSKLISLYLEFDSEGLEDFFELLKSKSRQQLGLYSEGFRKSLKEMIHTLLLHGYDRAKITPLVELWELHVSMGVQNRWERTDELLKIYEVYGLLENDEKARLVFQEMLDTSMGPSWYKESQVSLINTAMEKLKLVSDANVQDFASLLDHASGEMTFQRYVRFNKERFIGSLALNNRISLAIDYYKSEVMPPPATLIRNAEISDFDAPRPGDGYCLGARNIHESSGVLNMLEKISCNPYLRWALCQMFTINDDIFRYVDGFASSLASCLNEIEQLNDGNIDEISRRTAQLISSKQIDESDRKTLLSILSKNLSKTTVSYLQKHLASKKINWEVGSQAVTKEEEQKSKGKDCFDLFNESLKGAEFTNEKDIEEKLREGFGLYEQERRSIWYDDFSSSQNLTKKNLKGLLKNEVSVLKNLKDQILNFDNEYWVICKEIISFMEGKLTDVQTAEIYSCIKEHFDYMIRPTEEVKQKYSWIDQAAKADDADADDVVSGLIIWHLNHPDSDLVKRAKKVIRNLAVFNPAFIRALFHECASGKPEPSAELSSAILKKISGKYPAKVVAAIGEDREIAGAVGSISNLVIKKNLFDVGIDLNRAGYSALYLQIKDSIPNAVILTGKVLFEEADLIIIQDYIDDLNDELFLNEEFCIKVNALLDGYCHPLSRSEVKKSDKYLIRSFYTENAVIGRYNHFVKNALNTAISERAGHDNMAEIYAIINS